MASDKDKDFKDPDDGYFPPGTVHEDEFYSSGSLNFVWDKAKNERNIRVRGIDFKTAALVFNDMNAVYVEDDTHSFGEERENIIGRPINPDSVPNMLIGKADKLLFVVFTERISKSGDLYRIISARKAEKDEIQRYLDENGAM